MDIRTLTALKPRSDIPDFGPGDTVKVSFRVVEGDKERIQVFQGVVIRKRKGEANASFTVRRISHGVGVERTFLVHSPLLEKVDVVRHGKVRRAKLYYLRGLSGQGSRIREKRRQLPAELKVETPEETPEHAQETT